MEHLPKDYLATRMQDVYRYVQMRPDDHFRKYSPISINLGHGKIRSFSLNR